MRKLILIVPISLSSALFSFTPAKNSIANCFLTFEGSAGLTVQPKEQRPANAGKFREVKTNSGEVKISCIDGYRILYNNDKKVPFVNLKVELSNAKSYAKDTAGLIENLKYLNANSQGMETQDIIKMTFNGYNIYGLSRKSIEEGSTLGIFLLFPGNDITVYFYFNNLKPEYRHFESVDDYKKLRDQFMDDYTRHIKSCDDI
jgi:hypothetical protein